MNSSAAVASAVLLLSLSASAVLVLALTADSGSDLFNAIEADVCIGSDFVELHPEAAGLRECSMLCSSLSPQRRCQAFALVDGPCRLFVFDKCSKSVRSCSCSKRGQVFVKRQPGLGAGALCPSGYGDDRCGVKYKIYSEKGTWTSSRQKCESDSGLVIMADAVDANEMSHIESLYQRYVPTGVSLWLGARQLPGSPEPDGGWFWVGCNISVDRSVWNSPEPDNVNNADAAARWYGRAGLTDVMVTSKQASICECVSPFD